MDAKDSPKSNKKSGIIFSVVALASALAISWDQGLFGTVGESVSFGESESSRVRPPQNLPESSTFVLSDDPNKPSKIIQEANAPQRVQTAKDLNMIVGDYIDASPDKDAAMSSLAYTMALPSVTKEFKLQEQQTEIARMKFEEREWQLKLSKLENKGLDGFGSSEVNKIQTASSPANFDNYPLSQSKKPSNDLDGENKLNARDFVLLSVTEDAKGGLVALLSAKGKEYEVKNKANINGQFNIKIASFSEVFVCDADDCMTVY
jgi:hypothetical protein